MQFFKDGHLELEDLLFAVHTLHFYGHQLVGVDVPSRIDLP